MAPGIEVFGRRATIVEVPVEQPPARRTALLGLGALALAIATAVLTGLGVGAATAGDEQGAQWLATAAIAISILSVLAGLAALVTGRGRALGVVAAVLAVVANPWILLRLLEFFEGFAG